MFRTAVLLDNPPIQNPTAPGLGPNKFADPKGIAVHGNSYYIADCDNNRIVKYVVVMN